jgi:DNA polymerase III epsilon subunit-like protein
MKPSSDNIIFLDTEFSSLNPYKGEILSIGLVKLNGEELYLELEYEGEVDEWVKKNIIPTLKESKVNREKAIDRIKKFVGNKQPYTVAYVNQFDTIYIYKLFNIENHPFHWIPIDFASVLFSLGINPESYDYRNKDNFFEKIGIDHTKYREHHALDDARLLREVYLKFLENKF